MPKPSKFTELPLGCCATQCNISPFNESASFEQTEGQRPWSKPWTFLCVSISSRASSSPWFNFANKAKVKSCFAIFVSQNWNVLFCFAFHENRMTLSCLGPRRSGNCGYFHKAQTKKKRPTNISSNFTGTITGAYPLRDVGSCKQRKFEESDVLFPVFLSEFQICLLEMWWQNVTRKNVENSGFHSC